MKVTGNTTTRHDDGDGQHNNLVKMAASVIGHGILAGTYLAEYRDSLK